MELDSAGKLPIPDLHHKQADKTLTKDSNFRASDVTQCQNRDFKLIASSSHNSALRGVVILKNRRFLCLIEKTGGDEHGWFTYALGSWNHSKEISVYAPNKYDADYPHPLPNSSVLLTTIWSLVYASTYGRCCWHDVCKRMGSSKFTTESPVWNNQYIQSGNKPLF